MTKVIAAAIAVLLAVAAGQTLGQVTAPMEKVVRVGDIPWHALSASARVRAVTGDMAMMGFVEFDAGSITPVHNHPNEQFTYVVEGRLKVTVDGREHILGPGDVIVVPSYVPHGAVALEATKTVEAFGPTRADYQAFAK